MKKGFKIGALSLAGLMVFGLAGCGNVSEAEGKKWAEENGYVKEESLPALPASVKNTPECDVESTATKYGATCGSINSSNLTDYLGRSDVLYYDVRDAGTTAASFNNYALGHLKGFTNVEFFAYIYPQYPVAGTRGNQLFYLSEDGRFAANYAESVATLEALFPKDKTLFIMCAGGSRVVTLMQLLDQYGWDMDKVYNVGGWGQYTDAKYDDYKVGALTKYLEVTGTATGMTQGDTGDAISVNVKVLYSTVDYKIGGVYVTGGTMTSSGYTESWAAALNDLLDSFVGMDIEVARTKVSGGALAEGVDVVAGASYSTTLIYSAVINALESVRIE